MRKFVAGLAAAAALAAAVAFFLTRPTVPEPVAPSAPVPGAVAVEQPGVAVAPPEQPAAAPPPGPGVVAPAEAPAPPPAETPAPQVATAPEPIAEVEEPLPEYTGPLMSLDTSMVLASVNGVPITLKDLMPISPTGRSDRKMTPEMFTFLVDRAVTREATLQAAKAQGLELTPEQQASLELVRQRALERDPRVFSDAQDDYEAKAAFEEKDYRGLMMAETLLAASGGPPKYVTPEMVQQHYDQNKAEYGELPADEPARQEAWLKIDEAIRNKLAPQLEAEYQKSLEALLASLKGGANVQQLVTPPPAATAPDNAAADSSTIGF